MTKWSGRTSAYNHKHDDWKKRDGQETPSISMVKVFSAQWTNCPVEVEDQVKDYWCFQEFGNDNYYAKTSIEDLQEVHDEQYEIDKYITKEGVRRNVKVETDLIIEWLRENGVKDDEQILIHWW